jgi:hypothetical protein
MNATPKKLVRVLFDEFHSESWSISAARAKEIDPHNPLSSSYQIAADALSQRDFILNRNLDQPLSREALEQNQILVLLHPCDPKWERTTSTNSPTLSEEEIKNVQDFVSRGGGLIVVTEYEHEKYGNNLNELLAPFNLHIENTTVVDSKNCVHENPTWFFAEPMQTQAGLSHLVQKACFYRSASCTATDKSSLAWKASVDADPSNAGLIATAKSGEGRVVVVTDSSLFGDKHIQEHDHLQLWLNLFYWSSAPTFSKAKVESPSSQTLDSEAWKKLKSDIEALRTLQSPDGSAPATQHAEARILVDSILQQIHSLKPSFPHEEEYLSQLPEDFRNWMKGGFAKPDFGKSLTAFNPEKDRRHNLEHIVVFPMYTPNASRDTRFEAILLRTPWPDWLAELERTQYQNEKFVPGHLVDFTEGYKSECAVFFPETISVVQKPTNNFAMIFCDREAKRLQACALKAASIVHMELHPQLEGFLNSLPMIYDTLALWDLIHDKSHSMGELPFDPFMIRQRAPYWMYALEELRVDLRSFCEASRLAQNGFPFAHHVTYAILLDRIFRFPITGNRVRNYDSLGGELLFAYLHQKDYLVWSDNRLRIRWESLLEGVTQLREELQKLYKLGADCSKMSFWLTAHDLISNYVCPNVASQWKRDARVHMDETDTKKWIGLVQDDEFPLGNFHSNLLSKMLAMNS